MSSSRSSRHALPVRHEVRPWTRSDYVVCGVVSLFLYGLSPPWVMFLLHFYQAPGWVNQSLTYFYAPVNGACTSLPVVDMLYVGYHDLLRHWLLGL